MTVDLFDEFLLLIQRWSSRGEKYLSNGTRLICPVPHIAPEAWLHVLFAPLAENQLQALEEQCGSRLPFDFREFLLRHNGVLIFAYSVDVWGVRHSYVRTGDDAWQPFDMAYHNEAAMRPAGSPYKVLYFGSADEGATWCFFEFYPGGYRVGLTAREHFRPIEYWPSFSEWLLDQTRRLTPLHGTDGKKLD